MNLKKSAKEKQGARKSKGAFTGKLFAKENEFHEHYHIFFLDFYSFPDLRQNISPKNAENVKGCSQLKTAEILYDKCKCCIKDFATSVA